jgi:hypothetical protein
VSGKLPDARRWQGWGEVARLDARVIERCSFCAFEIRAPFEEARRAFEAHECGRPRPTSATRRPSGFALRH